MAQEKPGAEHHSIPKTLSQSIYNYIKNSIINNELKANQKINEKEIADTFGVSTTPVREAVLRLGAEGFVTVKSHREAVVKEICYVELKEIFQVLSALDTLAADLVVDFLSSEDLKDIESLTAEMESRCTLDSIEKYMAINRDIHDKIWESLPNKFLKYTLKYVTEQFLRYNYARIYAFQKPGVLRRSMNEHKKILQALRERDKHQLRTLLSNHWGSLLQPSPFADGLKEYLNNNSKEVRIREKKYV